MKSLKRFLSLIMCLTLLVTAVPVSAYDGPICKKHNYDMSKTSSYYDRNLHYISKGQCRKCTGWKYHFKKRHNYVQKGSSRVRKLDRNTEYLTTYYRCTAENKWEPVDETARHAYAVRTTTVNNRNELAKITTYTCRHSYCKFSYKTKRILHTHHYTKNRKGGKCKICGKRWA